MSTATLPPLSETLAANRYPGRGLVAARTADGELVITYFLTGRSPASQDRELRREGEDLVVVPKGAQDFDPLRHYAAVTRGDDWWVIGNGDQVAHIAGRVGEGHDLLTATEDVQYEPDPPICTSRITMLVRDERLMIHTARHARADRDETDSTLVRVGGLLRGEALLVTTYLSDGDQVQTALPVVEVRTGAATADALLTEVWDSLSPELRVAAVAIVPSRTDPVAAQVAR